MRVSHKDTMAAMTEAEMREALALMSDSDSDDDGPSNPPGEEKVQQPADGEEEKKQAEDRLKWSAKRLEIGDLLDAKDTVNNWCFAVVIEKDPYRRPGQIKVHFTRWEGPTYDAWYVLFFFFFLNLNFLCLNRCLFSLLNIVNISLQSLQSLFQHHTTTGTMSLPTI